MYSFIKMIPAHPSDFTKWIDKRESLTLSGLELRDSVPHFSKTIIQELKEIFAHNNITLIAFAGFTDSSKSFPIHKDSVDVLYMQTIGAVNWSVWESDSSLDNIEPHLATKVFEERFTAGDLIWIPRGTYHYVEPLGPRVAFSFGVEGEPDPKAYV